MKSKILRGIKVRSELKPAVSIKSAAFVYTNAAQTNIGERFRLMREAKAAEQPVNVVALQRKAGK